MPEGIAQVRFLPRNLTRRVSPLAGVQSSVSAAAKKGPLAPTFLASQTDFLQRFTADGQIPVDADDAMWSAQTYLAGGNQLWFRRVAPQATFANIVIGQAHDRDHLYGKYVAGSQVDSVGNAYGNEANELDWLKGDEALTALDDEYDNASSTGNVWLTDDQTGNVLTYDTEIDTSRASVTPFFDNSALSQPQVEEFGGYDDAVNSADAGVSGTDGTRKAPQLTLLYAASPGAWGDNIRVSIHADASLDSRADITAGEVRELRVYYNGSRVETLQVSRTPGLKDGRGQTIYIEDKLRRDSQYIRAVDSSDAGFLETTVEVGPVGSKVTRFSGSGYTGVTSTDSAEYEYLSDGSFDNGSDGATPDATDYSASISVFENLNIYPDIKLLMDGGQANETVAAKLGAVVAGRQHSQGIINLPVNAFNEGWESAAGTADTNASTYMAQAGVPKTKYVCAYGPRLLGTDEFNRREIYMPVDGVVAGNISRAAALGRQYDPPAGPELGIIEGFLDVKERLTDAQLNIMYDTLRINPIRYESGYGLNIWGQRTLESIPTAENDLHVRLMMIDIGPQLVRSLRRHIYRRNNPAERRLVYTLVSSFMEGVQRRGGVDRFEVVCDATNNTHVEESQNRMIVWLFIWPPGVNEKIDLYPILTPRDVTLADAIQAIAA